MDECNLDPCWYFTITALAWDASLKQTQVQLELIQDPEILYMVENGFRGGFAQCSKRYAEARNMYTEGVDVEVPESSAYLDANNLYGWAMCQPLPTGNCKLKKNKSNCELNEDRLTKQDASQKKGYISFHLFLPKVEIINICYVIFTFMNISITHFVIHIQEWSHRLEYH
jgi:hypothetical protein